MKKAIWIVACLVTLAGCATSSTGVAPLGDGRYMLHGSDLTGWGTANEVKAALLKEAGEFCAKQGKELSQVYHSGKEMGFITSANADITFRCK
ncbi:MAG: hypothetical protein PHE74_00200 [Comamonas sp.]|nr:hypothetical protein [Comamonas sp.]